MRKEGNRASLLCCLWVMIFFAGFLSTPSGAYEGGDRSGTTLAYQALTAEFTGEPITGTVPLAVQFTDRSTGRITRWEWSFGDGSFSGEQHPQHIYRKSGIYSVSLEISGPDGTTRKTRDNYVTVNTSLPTPIADFIVDHPTGKAPHTVQFLDVSSGDITSWEWDFGDGSTSTAQNPKHVYAAPGKYTVKLIVKGPAGRDTETRTDYIAATNPAGILSHFTAAPLKGPNPLTVNFRDASVGDISKWEWDFGDGGSSNEKNPRYTYLKPGTYTVGLTVTDTNGAKDTRSRTDYIKVDIAPPGANFTATPTSGTVPLTVQFTDTSTGEITSREWDFGDNRTGTLRNPEHTYTAPGKYTVALTVKGPGGTYTKTRTDYIEVTNPTGILADFKAVPTTGAAPLTVNFTDTSLGEITSRYWTFGDGGTSTLQNPTYAYHTPGIYTVTLTVSGPNGTDTETKSHYIVASGKIPTPVAEFTATPTNGHNPLTVNFSDNSTGIIDSWKWTFGDGSDGEGKNPQHIYEQPGRYTVTLSVEGPGGTDYETKEGLISVTSSAPPAPVAGFMATPTCGAAPLTVQFTDKSWGDITSREWDLGDPRGVSISTEKNPSHTYNAPGIYSIMLKVAGPGGGDIKVEAGYITVTATPALAPFAQFTATPTRGIAPLDVQFSDASVGEITQRLWEFGDGTTSTQVSPKHTYAAIGKYHVALTVMGPGGTSTRTKTDYIAVVKKPTEVVADFAATPNQGEAPLTVRFIENTSGEVTDWYWDFGDGTVSTQPNPQHVYAHPGTYTVSLTAKGPESTDTKTQIGYIVVTEKPIEVTADFSAIPVSGEAPLIVQFYEGASGEVTSWHWDFGDGETSEERNPQHIYANPGNYTVTLEVGGPYGSDTKTKTNYISAVAPEGWDERLVPTVGGTGKGQMVKAAVDTTTTEKLKVLLSQRVIDGRGRLYISIETPRIPGWEDYMWFRPRDNRVPPPPPYVILVKDTFGFFSSVSEGYYFDGTLSTKAKDLSFRIGDLDGLKGQTLIFKSWCLEFGISFRPENLVLIQSVEVTFN